MKVSELDVMFLKDISFFIDIQCMCYPEKDVNGVYTRVVKSLTHERNMGIDIEQDFTGMIRTPRTKEKASLPDWRVREIALRKFTRYGYYELPGWNKQCPSISFLRRLHQELESTANPAKNWYAGLDIIAYRVSKHYGTPIEAVA